VRFIGGSGEEKILAKNLGQKMGEDEEFLAKKLLAKK